MVCALAPKLQQAEMERAKRKPTENLDAYDYFLRGLDKLHQAMRDSVEEALCLFHKAIELDPQFAAAYGLAASCHARRKAERYETDRRKTFLKHPGWPDGP